MNILALTKQSLSKIKEKLSENNFPIEQFFEFNSYVILFSVKETDAELSLTVSAGEKTSDVMYTNFVFSGSKDELLEYLSEQKCLNKSLEYIENLLQKIEKSGE